MLTRRYRVTVLTLSKRRLRDRGQYRNAVA